MRQGDYIELFWVTFLTAVVFSLLALAVAALGHVPYPTFDPTLTYTFTV